MTNSTTNTTVDQQIVARAYRKLLDKEELSKQESDALKRHEKEKEGRLRRQYYAAIPQKHWREMSGRQTKVMVMVTTFIAPPLLKALFPPVSREDRQRKPEGIEDLVTES